MKDIVKGSLCSSRLLSLPIILLFLILWIAISDIEKGGTLFSKTKGVFSLMYCVKSSFHHMKGSLRYQIVISILIDRIYVP